ncbi:leucine-rich repeat-containing protein 74A-like [Dreissena polymorpha]|uniref:leucine-rich repeat-containing protein 74A-like n=1 Tax=Dreissena polymorpha TaxID=45954 RepID=UPI002264AECF|nr:leucine-rich repeat-containing protein 74A-like [Dreissena polymorpha]
MMTYYKACQDSATPPQRCIINALSTRTLSIRNRSLGPNAIPPICAAYRGNLRVEELTLDSADIGDAGMKHVSKMLINNFTITNVNNTSITHLDLSYNTLEEQAGLMLGSSLARNNTLVSLNLSWNKIRGKGAVAIFRALMLNNTVSNLNISWNGLGYEGTVALCKCLKRNTGLLDLDLANNRLNWRCALLLAEGLRSNSTLRNLWVGRNTITTTGAMDILEAVATTGSVIANLDLSDIPVIAEADLLAATISRRREFTFKHGGIVATHDKLGQRVGRELNPMLRIIEYLRLLGLRPLELMKSFDKNASLEMPRKDFVEQIRKIGVNLKPYEVDALANSVSGKGFNKNVINYRKLSMAVREVVEAERERKIRERKEWLQIKSYHENILNKGKVDEYIAQSPSSRSVDPVNALRVKSNETIGLSISRHSTGTSRLVSEVSRVKPALSIAMPAMLTEVKLPGKASKKPKKRSARM